MLQGSTSSATAGSEAARRRELPARGSVAFGRRNAARARYQTTRRPFVMFTSAGGQNAAAALR